MLILEGGGEGKLRGLAKSVISDGSCMEECIDHIMATSHKWLAISCYNCHSTSEQKLVQQLRNSDHITLSIHNRKRKEN